MTQQPDLPIRVGIIPVTPFQQNCTLLWCTKTNEGVVIDPGGTVSNIRNTIKQTGMTPTGIWLTHGHIDHAGGVAELVEHLKVPVTGPHQDDAFLLDEGDTVKVGEVEFAVRHCPGHSPGHVVFLNEELKFGHVGDVLFQGSIGRTDFEYGDHDALIDAIRTKLLPLPDDFTFICGHGPASTIGHERASNPFLK
jgi:hydroxyacylglutathione hydrolase